MNKMPVTQYDSVKGNNSHNRSYLPHYKRNASTTYSNDGKRQVAHSLVDRTTRNLIRVKIGLTSHSYNLQ